MSGRALSRRDVLVGACGGAAAIGLLGPSAVALASRDRPEEFDAAVPAAWFDLALVLVRTTPGFTPPVASRAFGYAGVALYEAVVPGSRHYRSLARVLPGLRRLPRGHGHLHWPAVANAGGGGEQRPQDPRQRRSLPMQAAAPIARDGR